ncbi:MAG: amino acid ABC transporter permease [Clostridiales bacterium]|jgi:polar amino acid transport system permease protein|nr:amino acid ABC transporter permease [Clostridiales bacterium]
MFKEITLQLLQGFGENLTLFGLTLIMSMPLGLLICFGSMSRFQPLRWLARTYVWIIRGSPLLLQLFIVFYVPGLVFGAPMKNRMMAALVAFVINYSAYFSEIYRGGIESISVGQYEAGHVLSMKRSQVFMRIVLPQVIKRIMPPISNEIITLSKDTSLARVIAVAEVIMVAERFTAKGLVWPLFYTGVFFLLFSGFLTLLFGFIEKKLNYYRG